MTTRHKISDEDLRFSTLAVIIIILAAVTLMAGLKYVYIKKSFSPQETPFEWRSPPPGFRGPSGPPSIEEPPGPPPGY